MMLTALDLPGRSDVEAFNQVTLIYPAIINSPRKIEPNRQVGRRGWMRNAT
jgi:hypothetical protein